MLDDLGVACQLNDEGLKAPKLQYRSKKDGVIAQFDFGEIADRTRHPYRVQSEQFKLTRILLEHLRNAGNSTYFASGIIDSFHVSRGAVRNCLRNRASVAHQWAMVHR